MLSRILLFCFVVSNAHGMPAELKLHGVFGNHMVIQRNCDIPIHGFGVPGRIVVVELDGQHIQVEIEPTGRWLLRFPPKPAGGPFTMSVSDGTSTLHIDDIRVGDVWLASGQSNMQYTLGQGVSGALPSDPSSNIRTLNLAHTPEGHPTDMLPRAAWEVASSESLEQFSAVAWFFAETLEASEQIPIGIIHASWGGSPIEAWMRQEVLQNLPHKAGPPLDLNALEGGTLSAFHAINDARANESEALIENLESGLGTGVHDADYDDRNWQTRDIPHWEELEKQIYWFRKHFHWNPVEGETLSISLGRVLSQGYAYLNGVALPPNSGEPWIFELPSHLIRPGENTLAIRITNPWFPPAFEGGASEFYLKRSSDGYTLSLFENWKYSNQVEPTLPTFYSLQTIPSVLFNGMIYPLRNTQLKGVIWYQGETNGDAGIQYRNIFPAMIQDWRALFQSPDLPFYWVQLANVGKPTELPEWQGWPLLREAQTMALTLPHSGMALALDVGDAYDIHPKNKQPVGYRLALPALRQVYRKQLEFSGPTFDSATFDGNQVTVRFKHATGLNTSDGKRPTSFSLAGEGRVFHLAEAEIFGDTIILSSVRVSQPVAVRYAWAQNPIVNLYNQAALPALPFRTDAWESPEPGAK